jgi:hypothetical protein
MVGGGADNYPIARGAHTVLYTLISRPGDRRRQRADSTIRPDVT